MKTDAISSNILEPLTWLLGEWNGEGEVDFPTHQRFDFKDYMIFKVVEGAFENEPIIHFEEIAKTLEDDEYVFKHWETGYFKPTLDGRIEFYICHNTGRIEITYGTYAELDIENRSFKIVFQSDFIRNDEGTKTALKSTRELMFRNGSLSYLLGMSTTDVPEVTSHLRSKLEKHLK